MIQFDWGQLSDSEFEEMCKDILRAEGFENVRRMSGPGPGDIGRDITAEETVSLKAGGKRLFKILVQCKNYGKSETTIGASEIERYVNRVDTLGRDILLVITSHDLSSQAKSIAEKISKDPRRRVLIDFWTEADLVDKLLKFPKIQEKYFVLGTTVKISTLPSRDFLMQIPATIIFEKLGTSYTVVFLVDTGCDTTMLSGVVAERIGMNLCDLKNIKLAGLGGFISAYELPDVTLIFHTHKGDLYAEKMDKILLIAPDEEMMKLPFCLLGMDVIKRFKKISFENGRFFLEK